MKKFAYLDSAEILHITKKEEIAKSHAKNGKVVATDYPAEGGYPVVGEYGEKRKAYILYSETEERHGFPIPEELAELYRRLK